MKKQILKLAVILGLFYTSNVLAMTQEEYQELVNSYKLINTDDIDKYTTLNSTYITTYEEYKDLLKSNNIEDNPIIAGRFIKYFKINGENINIGISPAIYRDVILTDISFPKGNFLRNDVPFNVDIYDQKLYSVACISKKKEIIIASILQSSTEDKKILFRELIGVSAEYYNDDIGYVGNSFDLDLVKNNLSLSIDKPYEENKTFAYFNEEKILAKLYEAKRCDKEETKKANIEVLTINGWIPQENSWNITKSENSINGIKFNENSSQRTNVGVD